ncbi:MAG: translocation/assembly module TamB [Planctomycetes bacterium]|nr:translocation/assembly module TamB [Planctomycetota bacterium]
MAAGGGTKKRKRWPWLALGGLGCVVAAYALRSSVIAPWLVGRIAAKLRDERGLDLKVGAVGGDWLTRLELRDVELSASDGSLAAKCGAIDARYSLLDVFSGGWTRIEHVRASGIDVRYDAPRRAPRTTPSAKATFAWPERLPACTLADARLDLTFTTGCTVALDGLELESPDGASFTLRAARGSYVSPETAFPAARVAAAGRFTSGAVTLSELAFDDEAALRRASVDLSALAEKRIAWDVGCGFAWGTLESRGTLDHERLSASFALDGADGAKLRSLYPPLARREWSGTLDAEGRLDARLARGGEFELAVRGKARGGDVLGEPFDTLATELVLDRRRIGISRLDVQRGADRLVAHDLVVPFADPLGGLRGRLELDAGDVPALVGEPELARDVPQHRVHLAALATESGVDLEEGRVTTESGVLEVDAGHVTFGATRENWLSEARVELSGRADFPDLAELGGAFGRDGWCGSVSGKVELSGGLAALVGALDLRGENVEIEGRAFGDVEIVAHVDRERLVVSRARANGAWGEFELSGEFDHRERRLQGVLLDARLAWPVPWAPSLSVAGDVEVQARADGELASPRVDFGFAARELELGGRTLESLDARGVWQGKTVRFDHLVARSHGLEAVATGEFSSLDWRPPYLAVIESLHAERDGRSLDLLAPVDLRIDTGSVDFDHAHLAGDAGRWIASCHWSPAQVAVAVELVELSPLGLLDPWLPEGVALDSLHGKFELLRDAASTTAAFDLAADRVRLHEHGRTYSAAVRGLFDDTTLTLERCELAEGERRVLSLSGTAPFDPFGATPFVAGELALELQLAIQHFEELPRAWRPPGGEPRGQLAARLSLGGTWREPSGRLALEACALELDGTQALVGRRIGPCDVELELAFDRDVRIERLFVEDLGRARVRLAGALGIAPRPLAWLEDGLPLADDVALDLVATLDVDDLSFARRIAPELGRVGGRVYAELGFGASLAQPTWSGSLQLADGEIRFENELPRLANLAADVRFAGYVAEVRQLSGTLGSGPFQAKGRVELADDSPRFELEVHGQEILLARADDLRLRADADLTVVGPLERLRVGGELRLRDGRYTKNFELLDRLGGGSGRSRAVRQRGFSLPTVSRGPFARAEFLVDVRSEEPLRIDNNVLRASLRPSLRLRGTGAAPTLAGAVFVEQARIGLPSGTLRIDGGTITLPDQVPIVPKLELRGEARVAGYDVVASLDGAYDEPIVLSSSPPLSQSDLVVLLLTGRPPADTFAATSERAAQTVAVYLGQDVLSRWFGGEKDGETLVERIEWLQGQELTKSGGQTTQVSLRLSRDDGGARRVVYLRGEKDVYDRVNFGVKLLFRFP